MLRDWFYCQFPADIQFENTNAAFKAIKNLISVVRIIGYVRNYTSFVSVTQLEERVFLQNLNFIRGLTTVFPSHKNVEIQ